MSITPPFTPNTAPRRIEILAFADVQLLDVAGPLQAFASANEIDRPPGQAPPYATRVVAREAGMVATSAGLGLAAGELPAADAPVDTLIVAGGRGVDRACEDPALRAWLAERAGHVRRLVSVCSGALLLAASGLLDGRRVATHWRRCGQLARQHPAVRVEREPIFVRDGAIWTSAGITAGIDLALALIEDDLGRAAALAVAQELVVFMKRPGGQTQFSAALSLQGADDRFAALHAWMRDNLAEDLSVPALAARAGQSERTFQRRYREVTGMPPAKAVERLRVEEARRLLLDTALPVKAVARRSGLGDEETLRRSFLRIVGIAPSDYRARFATTGRD